MELNEHEGKKHLKSDEDVQKQVGNVTANSQWFCIEAEENKGTEPSQKLIFLNHYLKGLGSSPHLLVYPCYLQPPTKG